MDPAVEPLGKVVEVVLVAAVTGPSSLGGIVLGHTDSPTVVCSECGNDVTTVVVDHLTEKLSASADVVVDVPAAVVSASVLRLDSAQDLLVPSFTVRGRDLHQTRLTTATCDPGLAS